MINTKNIIEFLAKPVVNNKYFDLIEPCSIFDVRNKCITYIYKDNISYLDNLNLKGDEILVIIPKSFENKLNDYNNTFIISETPKQDFVNVLKKFFVNDNKKVELIHKTAIIDEKAKIHSTVQIGPFSIIGECEIGENTKIYDNVVISDKVIIGNNVRILSGCSIGTEDFGPVRLEDDTVEMFPQIGGVIIEDNVEIFPLTCIGRGTLGNTFIKRGVKIDHQCQIGHNSEIGENTVITAQSIICGSTKIGKNCYIGVNSVLRNENKLGNNVIVGMGSMVTKDFGDNLIIYGNPARIIKDNHGIFKF